jgi:hypothetical protein
VNVDPFKSLAMIKFNLHRVQINLSHESNLRLGITHLISDVAHALKPGDVRLVGRVKLV